jgi:hypothetical protein
MQSLSRRKKPRFFLFSNAGHHFWLLGFKEVQGSRNLKIVQKTSFSKQKTHETTLFYYKNRQKACKKLFFKIIFMPTPSAFIFCAMVSGIEFPVQFLRRKNNGKSREEGRS